MASDDRIVHFDCDDRFFLDVKGRAIKRLGYTEATDIAKGKEGNPNESGAKAAPDRIIDIIDEGISDLRGALGRSGPLGVYRILPILDISSEGIKFQGGTVESRMWEGISKSSRGKKHLLFAVITIGAEFEKMTGRLPHISNQMIYETIGSEAVEVVTDRIQLAWEKEIEDFGLQMSYRFSPGYCDWGLSGQGAIFGTVRANEIGVRLTPSYSMLPLKSISCCAIIAREVPIKFPCVFCKKAECPHRRGG